MQDFLKEVIAKGKTMIYFERVCTIISYCLKVNNSRHKSRHKLHNQLQVDLVMFKRLVCLGHIDDCGICFRLLPMAMPTLELYTQVFEASYSGNEIFVRNRLSHLEDIHLSRERARHLERSRAIDLEAAYKNRWSKKTVMRMWRIAYVNPLDINNNNNIINFFSVSISCSLAHVPY